MKPAACRTVMVTPTQAVKYCIASQLGRVKAGQAAVGAELCRSGIARAGAPFVTVAIAHHACPMPQRKAVRQQPFDCAPRGMDLHCRFIAPVVSVLDIGVTAASVRIAWQSYGQGKRVAA